MVSDCVSRMVPFSNKALIVAGLFSSTSRRVTTATKTLETPASWMSASMLKMKHPPLASSLGTLVAPPLLPSFCKIKTLPSCGWKRSSSPPVQLFLSVPSPQAASKMLGPALEPFVCRPTQAVAPNDRPLETVSPALEQNWSFGGVEFTSRFSKSITTLTKLAGQV